MDKAMYKAIGKSILLASMIFSIGSVVMSSIWSVINFSTEQDVLDRARDALAEFFWIAVVWGLGCACLLFASYGPRGLVLSVLASGLVIGWIYSRYCQAFRVAAAKNGLVVPRLTPW